MTPVTVCWHPLAERELNEIWIDADDRASVSNSSNEIDQLLKRAPGTKGLCSSRGRCRLI